MLRKSSYIPAIISVCLSWLLPVVALVKVIHQRATQPQACIKTVAGSSISGCAIFPK